MEENQITCPQCGLVNNILADACVQCGIIFVKDPAKKAAAAVQNEENRKSMETVEAAQEETQPSEALDTPVNETIKRPDPHEDTVEIRVPKRDENPPIDAASPDAEISEPDEPKDENTAEIELEAIETAMEAVTEPTGAESIMSTGAKADEPPKAEAEETVEKADDTSSDPQKEAKPSDDADTAVAAKKDSQDSKVDEPLAKDSKDERLAADSSPQSAISPESEKKHSAPAAPAESEAADQQVAELVKADDDSKLKADVKAAEAQNQTEVSSEVAPDENAAAGTETLTDAPPSQESTPEKAEVDAQAKQEEQKARQEALVKQQEALLKAEALKKEEAAKAKAAELKKKKIAKAKAEALKKQKAAQAKAEALKKKKAAQAKALALKKQKQTWAKADALRKQKAAQAKAEESAETVEVAAPGQSNYVKLLGLLKRYKGKAIGINYDNSAEIKEAELVEANEEFFSVMVKEKKVQYSYPLKTILTIIEGEQGVETGEDDKKAKFDAVIKVYPLVLF